MQQPVLCNSRTACWTAEAVPGCVSKTACAHKDAVRVKRVSSHTRYASPLLRGCVGGICTAGLRVGKNRRRYVQRACKSNASEEPGLDMQLETELSMEIVTQRCLNPCISQPWIVVGDLLTLMFAAPAINVFFLRVGVITPEWFRLVADTDRGFVFPEFAHGVGYATCWLFGGLAAGAFAADAVDSKNLIMTIRRTLFAAAVTMVLASLAWSALSLTGLLLDAYASTGYVSQSRVAPTFLDVFLDFQTEVLCLAAWRFTQAVGQADGTGSQGPDSQGRSLTQLGTIDSRLLLGDMFVSGVVAPALVVGVYLQTNVYTPEWTILWDATDYGVSKAVTAHGAVLTTCWLFGAVLAGAYGEDSMAPTNLAATLKRIWTAGSIATLLLAIASWLSLYFEDSRVAYLTNFDAERRLAHVFFDFVTDVEFEAICLTTWRLWFADYI